MNATSFTAIMTKVALCVAALIMTSLAQEIPVSRFCGQFGQSENMKNRCSAVAANYIVTRSVQQTSEIDRAVIGYLCCLGLFCAKDQKDYLVYADNEYVGELAMQQSSDAMLKMANHLRKCGLQRSTLTSFRERELCKNRRINLPGRLSIDAYKYYELTGKCRS